MSFVDDLLQDEDYVPRARKELRFCYLEADRDYFQRTWTEEIPSRVAWMAPPGDSEPEELPSGMACSARLP